MTPTRPVLRVVRGQPTDEELAALVAVVGAIGAPAPLPAAPRSTWAEPARNLQGFEPVGRGGWRTSARPR